MFVHRALMLTTDVDHRNVNKHSESIVCFMLTNETWL